MTNRADPGDDPSNRLPGLDGLRCLINEVGVYQFALGQHKVTFDYRARRVRKFGLRSMSPPFPPALSFYLPETTVVYTKVMSNLVKQSHVYLLFNLLL